MSTESEQTMTYTSNANRSNRPGVKFWDRMANSYSKKPISDEASYQRKLQVTQGYLRSDMNVLEFGCGTGSTALSHAPLVSHIQAIDISPRMIEIAREKAATQELTNVGFEVDTIEEFDTSAESYDVVLGLSFLHLLHNPDRAMRKVHKFLKPGGVFISSTACLGDNMRYFGPIAFVGRVLRLLPLVNIFTTADLKSSLIAAGFTIEHTWCPGKNKSVFVVARKPE